MIPLIVLILLIILFGGGGGYYSTRSGWGGEALPSVLYLLAVIILIALVLNLVGAY
jgi:uncharacterized membrane protein